MNSASGFVIENGVLKKYKLIQDLSSNIDDETEIAATVFRGHHDEITRVMRYLGTMGEETKISETISEFTTAGLEKSQLKSALREFPSLKAAMFVELWNRGTVEMAYSHSGYPFVTDWL